MRRRLFIGLLSLFLTACGFHLRGMMEVPTWLHDVAISADAVDTELVAMLKSQLNSSKVKVHRNILEAPYLLVITNSNFQQRIISIGASTNPRQYELILTVELMLQSKKGEILLPKRQIMVTRQLTVNNDRILGSNEEERILMNEMRQEAIIQLCSILFKSTPMPHAN